MQIKCENISIGYESKPIIENLTFDINKGDYLCVVGENGVGKSTLIKTILGLLPLVKGQINFCDGLKPTEIGYLPQQTIIQKDFPATVKEVVLSGFQNRKFKPFYTKTEKELALSNLAKLNADSLFNKCYRELSGGQQQRVLLARAMCATQKMLLLDEPVAGLDPMATKEMYELLKSLNAQGITIIMITHDISSALTYASHILFVSQNAFYGTCEEFKQSEYGEKYKHFVGGCTNE